MKKLLKRLKHWTAVKIALQHHKKRRKYQLYRRRLIINRWKEQKMSELNTWALGVVIGDIRPTLRYEYIKNMSHKEMASFIAGIRTGGCSYCPLAMECVHSSCEDAHAAWLKRAVDIKEVQR